MVKVAGIKVLAVDDDPSIGLLYENLLEEMGFDFAIAANISDARRLVERKSFDLILLDLELPDGNGLDLLPDLTARVDAPEVIIITGTGDTRGAELAFKYGAWDYVPKPFKVSEVSLPIIRALEYRKEKLVKAAPRSLVRSNIVGESAAIQKCLHEVGNAAATDASVLITGETGTGKELFARAIHENSRRAGKPFVVVDCAALPENLLESTIFGHEKGSFTGAHKRQAGLLAMADGGTVMLDEVGDLPLTAQKTFLRTLQERLIRPIGGEKEIPFDVRLVAATNLNLQKMVEDGQFRQDLFYRIRALEITLPPLRERGQDIEEIALRKLFELSTKYGMEMKAVSPEFFKALHTYKWPGNIRELINVLEYVLASAGSDPTLFPKHLPPEFRVSGLEQKITRTSEGLEGAVNVAGGCDELPSLNDFRDRNERAYLEELIQRRRGDRKKACLVSGISQSRLYSLIKKHALQGFGS